VFFLPFVSNRQHLGSDAGLEDKREDKLLCAVLCMTVVNSDVHT